MQVKNWLLICGIVFGATLLPHLGMGATPEVEARIRRIESAISLANQEQQSLHTQFQMLLEMGRVESQQYNTAIPQAGVSAPPMNYDDLARMRQDHEYHIKQRSDELNRLYERHREIEQEKLRLREQLNQLLDLR